MPKVYKVGEDRYDINEGQVNDFLKDFPNATEYISMKVGSDRYDILPKQKTDFLKDFPNATEFSSISNPNAPKSLQAPTQPTETPFAEKIKEAGIKPIEQQTTETNPLIQKVEEIHKEQPTQLTPTEEQLRHQSLQEQPTKSKEVRAQYIAYKYSQEADQLMKSQTPDIDKAKQLYEQSNTLLSTVNNDPYKYKLGIHNALKVNDYQTAIKLGKQLETEGKLDFEDINNVAKAYTQNKDYKGAIDVLSKAANIDLSQIPIGAQRLYAENEKIEANKKIGALKIL